MLTPDKHRPHSSPAGARVSSREIARAVIQIAWLSCCIVGLASCNRMITPRSSQLVKDADTRAREGNFLQAIDLYESALDGSASAADIHYKLALLYDDKMNEPLNALHHFKRYLTLAPSGAHANEAKNFMKRDELALVTSMSGDSVVSRAEAARLKNENLRLQKEIEDRATQARLAAANDKAANKGADKTSSAKPAKSGPHKHVVESGDTLFSLSRKYYNSPDHWKEIRRANRKSLDSSGKLKVGQTLTIP